MKKLSKEKKNHLLLVGLLTAGALAGLWFGLLKAQRASLAQLAERRQQADKKLQLAKRSIATAEQVQVQLAESARQLESLESGMAGGDIYSWFINTIRQFKAGYKVEIPQFSAIDGPKETTLLAQFPYRQASLTIGGTAEFYELGRFVADFENQHPYMRILNLSLEPTASTGATERERLGFRMELVTLVKPNAS
jgi:hypothetical protein